MTLFGMPLDRFEALDPRAQAVVAGLSTWFVTAAGAGLVFVTRRFPTALLDAMMGFAAGVMMAASVWSLLLPAIDLAERAGNSGWLVAAFGIAAGGFFLRIADFLLPHLHPGFATSEGPRTSWQRSTLLVLAITLHNVPEGLAVGVAFGAAASGVPSATLAAAVALTIGIGLQNFPEGVAVAVPLHREGMSAGKSFWYGQLSAVVEPVAALAGVVAVLTAQALLPFALSFAAGAMLYVVIEELIPASQQHAKTDLATVATLGGFIVMMVLDVALG